MGSLVDQKPAGYPQIWALGASLKGQNRGGKLPPLLFWAPELTETLLKRSLFWACDAMLSSHCAHCWAAFLRLCQIECGGHCPLLLGCISKALHHGKISARLHAAKIELLHSHARHDWTRSSRALKATGTESESRSHSDNDYLQQCHASAASTGYF